MKNVSTNYLTLKISEIYLSIQGESTYAGRPCIFVRLTGCDLRCTYCDSEYTFYEGKLWTLEVILEKVLSLSPSVSLVELTGGEPMAQKNTPLLAEMLLEKGYEVLIETSGSQNLRVLDSRVVKICDVKTPSSGESHQFVWENLEVLSKQDQLKFVIGDQEDFQFAKKWVEEHPFDGEILFSPVYEDLEPQQLAEWILQSDLKVRLQLQLHKIIWPEAKRGV